MFSNCTTENCNFTKNWALSRLICRLLITILLDTCVCVCVCARACVCVCVCLFILFQLLASFDFKTSVTYRRCSDQRLLLWVLLGASVKFLNLRVRKYHVSPPKTKTPDHSKLERKRFHIMYSAKRWYILSRRVSSRGKTPYLQHLYHNFKKDILCKKNRNEAMLYWSIPTSPLPTPHCPGVIFQKIIQLLTSWSHPRAHASRTVKK